MKTSHLALAVLLAACGSAAGGTSWHRPPADPGDWFDGSNWTAGVPHSGAPAYINNGGAAVIGSGTGEAERLFFGYSFGSAGGSLAVTGGGELSTREAHLGDMAGAVGTVTVTGTGSTCTVQEDLYVGNYGSGRLVVTDGAKLVNYLAPHWTQIAGELNSSGEVWIDGSGAAWTSAGSIYVGHRGVGTLTITRGASVSGRAGGVGFNVGGRGSVLVDGPDSTWAATSMAVGFHGSGRVEVANGGRITTTLSTSVGLAGGPHSEIVLHGAGSAWIGQDNMYIGGGQMDAGGPATVTVGQGATLEMRYVKVWPAGALCLAGGTVAGGDVGNLGLLTGAGTIRRSVVSSGTVAPGDSAGLITIDGAYTQQADGALLIEIAGPGAGQFDALAVGGAAALDGALDVSLSGGYLPAVGETFEILTCTARSGTFAGVGGLDLGGGRTFEIGYSDTAVTLTTVPEPAAAALTALGALALIRRRRTR